MNQKNEFVTLNDETFSKCYKLLFFLIGINGDRLELRKEEVTGESIQKF